MLDTIKKIGTDTFRAAEEHSPEICLIAGIAGVIGGTILACRGTLKAKKVIEESTKNLENINEAEELGSEEYTHEDAMKEKVAVAIRTAMGLARSYGPSALVLVGSILLLVKGHKILKKRNLALVAAYEGMSGAFKKYREKVEEIVGEDCAKRLRYGLEEKEIEVETGKKNKDGTPKTKKEKRLIIGDNPVDTFSPYCRIYDAGCRNWTKDPIYNRTFLQERQNWWNDVLLTRPDHTVFLNEIYGDLGFPKTTQGQVVGWSIKDGQTIGDGFIDFGIYNLAYQPNVDFVNGYEPVCILDFNVDGIVLDKLGDGTDNERI